MFALPAFEQLSSIELNSVCVGKGKGCEGCLSMNNHLNILFLLEGIFKEFVCFYQSLFIKLEVEMRNQTSEDPINWSSELKMRFFNSKRNF